VNSFSPLLSNLFILLAAIIPYNWIWSNSWSDHDKEKSILLGWL